MPSALDSKVLANQFPASLNALKRHGENDYPKYIWYIFLGFIGLAAIVNICSILWVWGRRRNAGHVRSSNVAHSGGALVQRIPTAFLTASRILAYRWKIPLLNMNILEASLTSAYIIIIFSFEFCNTQGLTLRYFANRAGHIAAVQIPLIVALSSKNNVIGLLTGVSHEKLNLMHRAIARVTLVMIWVHWWSRVATAVDFFGTPWKVCGFAAGIIMTVLVIISIRPIRKRFYELFYITHIILVSAIMILALYHTFNAGFPYYVYPCFIIWGLDRLCRYLHYLLINDFFHPKANSGELELLNHDALRLTIKRRILGGWRAGQHAYLAFPTINPTQSHPFTIATVPEVDGDKGDLTFIIRVREGFTRRMRDHVREDGTCQLPVFMDGPYGAPPDLTPFSTCVFLAGGSGISYTLPRLQAILRKISADRACARRLTFVWAVHQRSHIRWISKNLAGILSSVPSPASLDLSVSIYVTSDVDKAPSQAYNSGSSRSSQCDIEKQPNSPDSATDEKASSDMDIDSLENCGVRMCAGRPGIHQILEEEAAKSEGPMSVDVSGPEPLVAAVRTALSGSFASPLSVLRGTSPTIQLNVESFTM